jgi:hypothetical protein
MDVGGFFFWTMRSLLYIILTIASVTTLRGQTISLFQVTDTILTEKEKGRIEKLKKGRAVFFEDSTYSVTNTCSGEWGGTIRFTDKKTNIEYSCESTCPVSVTKKGGEYIITSSLAHGSGSTEIIKISDPRSMDVFQLPPPRKKKGKKVFRYVGDNESKSKAGTETLLDSVGVLTLSSFVFERQLFHVVTDFKKTYIAKIENKKFVLIELICNERTWTYDNDSIVTEDGHMLITIQGGYIDIFDNQVRLLRAS